MKKIMFILAFVGVGLFANASDGKIKKTNFPIKKELIKEKTNQVPPSVYIKIHCADGRNFVVCCYWSTYAANLAAPDWTASLCD